MQSYESFNVGERVLVDTSKWSKVPIGTWEAIVQSVEEHKSSVMPNGRYYDVSVKLDDPRVGDKYNGETYLGDGVAIYPFSAAPYFKVINELRDELATVRSNNSVRQNALLDALTAVGKGLGDDIRASLARIEAALAGSR